MKRAFVPFDETKDLRHLKWKNEDPMDKVIPKIDGFITDLIYATRGREISTLYGIWSALYLISSVAQRDAWLLPPGGDPWLDKDFLNIFLLFVGPAGSGKSSAVKLIQKILTKANFWFKDSEDPWLRRKESCEIGDASTPEAFLGTLARHAKNEENNGPKYLLGESKIINIEPDKPLKAISNGNAMLSEFASLLGRKNYTEGMSTNLLTLYDCPEVFKWNTVKRGLVYIPQVYLNIVGAATQDGMTSSVNPAVLEDGFMSRVIMCYVPNYSRKRSERFQTQCSLKDITRRLLWISKNCKGSYHLNDESRERYTKWYDNFIDRMNKNPDKAGYLIRNRTVVLKVAALLKMSEYTKGNTIEIRHLEAAFKLVTNTYKIVSGLMEYFTDTQIGAAKQAIKSKLIRSKSGMTRRSVAQQITRWSKEVVEKALTELYLQGVLLVIDDSGNEQGEPMFYPKERYMYVRPKTRPKSFELDED